MPFIIGGLMAATSIMGSMGGASQNKAQAMAAQMQQDQQNFNGRWQNEAANRNVLRQWEAQYHVNRGIERVANKTAVNQRYYAKEMFNNTASQLSKQTKSTTDMFLGSVASMGISQDSASARAVLRQTTLNAQKNSANLRTNYENQVQDIESQYENMLSQRRLGSAEQSTFMDTKGGIVDSSSSMLMTGIATGVMGGIAGGVGSYNQAGGLKGTASGKLFGVG
jgi:hypothetical protein